MNQQPPPLDYERPGGSPPPLPSGFLLFFRLITGSAVSAVIWIWGWNTLVEHETSSVLFTVPAVKVIAAVILIRFTSLQHGADRAFGIGLLLSIGVGFLIFFGSCYAHLR